MKWTDFRIQALNRKMYIFWSHPKTLRNNGLCKRRKKLIVYLFSLCLCNIAVNFWKMSLFSNKWHHGSCSLYQSWIQEDNLIRPVTTFKPNFSQKGFCHSNVIPCLSLHHFIIQFKVQTIYLSFSFTHERMFWSCPDTDTDGKLDLLTPLCSSIQSPWCKMPRICRDVRQSLDMILGRHRDTATVGDLTRKLLVSSVARQNWRKNGRNEKVVRDCRMYLMLT